MNKMRIKLEEWSSNLALKTCWNNCISPMLKEWLCFKILQMGLVWIWDKVLASTSEDIVDRLPDNIFYSSSVPIIVLILSLTALQVFCTVMRKNDLVLTGISNATNLFRLYCRFRKVLRKNKTKQKFYLQHYKVIKNMFQKARRWSASCKMSLIY